MAGILWFLLSCALIAVFIVLCCKAIVLLKRHIGVWAAAFFAICLLSLCGKPDSNENRKPLKTFYPKFSNEIDMMYAHKQSKKIILDERSIYNIHMEVIYGWADSTNDKFIVDGYSYVSGFTGGEKWKPESILITFNESSGKVEYSVNGTIEWLLLGVPIVHQGKSYSGVIDIK